ncbi:unnamed protein product [Phytophthora fragariaefolia]|uniref:Unnamed protein product n=1 Tax=Phytophthora fragariaefolia TaxID=1490495 RepID=A0A9W6U5Q1_9STRA|nr:unnamed protein product [Phytophthora fragariaefolia]
MHSVLNTTKHKWWLSSTSHEDGTMVSSQQCLLRVRGQRVRHRAEVAAARLVALDVGRYLSQSTARAAQRREEVVAGVPRDLEALAGRLAQVHHEESENHVHEHHDGAKDEHGAASVIGRVGDCSPAVSVAGLDRRAAGARSRGKTAHHKLGKNNTQADNERLGVGGNPEACGDLRHRNARAACDHEAVGHQVREAVPESDLPLTPCQSVLALEVLPSVGRLRR